jgi:ComF family protein
VDICGACVLNPPAVDHCYAAVDYAYPWADVLHGFKFGSDPGWASSLAQLMYSMPWVEPALDAAHVLLPIPLAPERLRERGYNQAALLAQALSARKTDCGTLLRLHWTPPQSGLNRAQRLRNLQGAFVVNPKHAAQLAGQHVLLVDDVMTTGATLDAAAHTLRAAGVATVSALVLARTGVD